MADDGEALPDESQAFHFSTESFREHERIDAWREVFGRTLLNIDIAPKATEGFQAAATGLRAPGIGLLRATTSAARQGNSRALITSDDISFCCVLDAPWNATQLGRSTDLAAGDGVLLSNGDVGALDLGADCRMVTFGLPKAALASLVPDLGVVFARRIRAGSPAQRILLRYLDIAEADAMAADPDLRTAFAHHVVDLLVLALGAGGDAAEQAGKRGLTDARLRAMQQDIRAGCTRPNLSVHSLAAAHGVSARYVQRLFEESGTTFTEYLVEQRLLAAFKALRRSRLAAAPISTIAYDSGFSDVSHFNRLFRRRFGCTPREARNAITATLP